jgi:hypothetical protein
MRHGLYAHEYTETPAHVQGFLLRSALIVPPSTLLITYTPHPPIRTSLNLQHS